MSDADPPDKTLLSGSFSFARPTLFCARAHLYDDRLELTGWRLTGRASSCAPSDGIVATLFGPCHGCFFPSRTQSHVIYQRQRP